jgi:hypothetical protein
MAISPKRTSGPRRRESVLAHYFNDCPVTRAEPVFGFCGTIVLLAVPLEHYTKPLVGPRRHGMAEGCSEGLALEQDRREQGPINRLRATEFRGISSSSQVVHKNDFGIK